MPGNYGDKKGYKMEKNPSKKKAMKNPSKDSGTMSCTSKGIRSYK